MLIFLQIRATKNEKNEKINPTQNSIQKKNIWVVFILMKSDRNLDLEDDRSASDDMVRNPRLDQSSKLSSDIKG
jgi:hypothetical protein